MDVYHIIMIIDIAKNACNGDEANVKDIKYDEH